MACKNSQPPARCGDCQYINRTAYRGAGYEVCYQLEESRDGRKVAKKVKETQKACNKFWAAVNKVERAV